METFYLCQVHEVTGDTSALSAAVTAFQHLQTRFKDPNTYPYNYGSLSCSKYGMLYAITGSGFEAGQYGVSTLYEVGYALVALYISTHASLVNAPAGDYLSYAEGVWNWLYKYLRYNGSRGSNPDNANATPNYSGATGIYFHDLDIKPYVLSNLTTSAQNTSTPNEGYLQAVGNGGSSSAGAYPGGTNNSDTQYGPPVRANSATYSSGMLGMAVLSARLYAATNQQAYIQECQSIAGVFYASNAFGRSGNLLCNEREPWTEGQFYAIFCYEVLGLSGVDSSGTLSSYIQSTASNILNTCVVNTNGVRTYEADWSGPESPTSWPPNTNTAPLTWQASYPANGSAQARWQQIMTQANTVLVLLAGAYCSGMDLSDATEQAAGLESTLDQKAVDTIESVAANQLALTPSPSSGSFSSASYNVTYVELPNRLVWMAGTLVVSSVGTASGKVNLPLPVPIAQASNGTASVNVRAYDYSNNTALDLASVSYTTLRLQTSTGQGTPYHSGSTIKFDCIYQGAS